MPDTAPCPDCGATMQDRGAGLECPACGHVQGWEPLAALPCPGCATRSTDGADHTCYRTCPECGATLLNRVAAPAPIPAAMPPIAADCPRCCQVEYGITRHCADHCEEGMPF